MVDAWTAAAPAMLGSAVAGMELPERLRLGRAGMSDSSGDASSVLRPPGVRSPSPLSSPSPAFAPSSSPSTSWLALARLSAKLGVGVMLAASAALRRLRGATRPGSPRRGMLALDVTCASASLIVSY